MVRNLSLAVVLLATTVIAQDWPRFRGVDGAGHASGEGAPVPESIDDAVFRVRLPGKGHSSPIIVGERVLLTATTEESKRVVVALSAKDGSTLWTHEVTFEPHHQHRFNSFASATLAADAEHVYASWTSGTSLVAMALTLEGKAVWERKLGSHAAQHGSGASPIVVDGVLVVGNDHETDGSFLCGLDCATGKELWRRERESTRASYATPILRREDGKPPEVLFASTSHGITSLNPKTGALNWETGALFKQRCVGAPAIAGSMLFAAAGSGGGGKEAVLLELPTDAEGKARIITRPRRALPYVPTPIGIRDRFLLVGDGGVLTWIEAATGELIWRERLKGGYYASPIVMDDHVYLVSRDGVLHILAAKDEFRHLAELALEEPCSATPAFAHGRLFVRTERTLFAFGAK